VVQPGKSPYLNGHFNQNVATQQSSASSTTSADNPPVSQSSGKANRKGASSAEITDSSTIVHKNKNSQESSATSAFSVPIPSGGVPLTNQTKSEQVESNGSNSNVDNMKLLAAIQRMR
jgi:hypothetical protein